MKESLLAEFEQWKREHPEELNKNMTREEMIAEIMDTIQWLIDNPPKRKPEKLTEEEEKEKRKITEALIKELEELGVIRVKDK